MPGRAADGVGHLGPWPRQMDKDGDLESAVYPQLCTVATVLWRQLLLPHYGVLGDDAVKQKDKVPNVVATNQAPAVTFGRSPPESNGGGGADI